MIATVGMGTVWVPSWFDSATFTPMARCTALNFLGMFGEDAECRRDLITGVGQHDKTQLVLFRGRQ